MMTNMLNITKEIVVANHSLIIIMVVIYNYKQSADNHEQNSMIIVREIEALLLGKRWYDITTSTAFVQYSSHRK